MKSFIIVSLVLIMVGILLLIGYKKLFKVNSKNALADKPVLSLPDLNDLLMWYIYVCLIIFTSLGIHISVTYHDQRVSKCVEEDVSVRGITSEYPLCINQYSNVVFKDHDEVIQKVLLNNEALIEQLEKRPPIATDKLDNLYYRTEGYAQDTDGYKLHVLLTIYLNYYEIKTIENSIEVIK
ncbi:MAG: hypothetical protein GX760_06005 [Erysipelothrix sp.]|nr:hypothetical protein [Erysipelothrix sp.]